MNGERMPPPHITNHIAQQVDVAMAQVVAVTFQQFDREEVSAARGGTRVDSQTCGEYCNVMRAMQGRNRSHVVGCNDARPPRKRSALHRM